MDLLTAAIIIILCPYDWCYGSGTNHSTAQSGGGRGSSNAVATFYWEIHSYNINTHDTIIRIHTTGNNNQGIVALIEKFKLRFTALLDFMCYNK